MGRSLGLGGQLGRLGGGGSDSLAVTAEGPEPVCVFAAKPQRPGVQSPGRSQRFSVEGQPPKREALPRWVFRKCRIGAQIPGQRAGRGRN